jgi:L-iditol 2-dehydrogenase
MIAAAEQAEVARLHAPRDLRLHREPVSDAGPGEVLLRVTAVGLCGSDRHWFLEGGVGDARLERPLVLGHEFAGVIADGPRAGERVVADPSDACGDCELCRSGRSNLCRSIRFAGHGTTDGALRSVMPWPERLLHRLPGRIPDEQAALLEPLGVAIHALDLGQPKPARSAAVIGCGPIGLLLVALLRGTGVATVVAADRLPHRVAAASAMGASAGVEIGEPVGRTAGLSDGGEVDVAFEVAGDDDALADAMATVRPGGRIVMVGIPPGDRTSFPASMARRKGLTIVHCRRMLPVDLERAIGLVTDGAIDLADLVSHRYPLARTSEAFGMLASRGGLKVVVSPSPVPGGS